MLRVDRRLGRVLVLRLRTAPLIGLLAWSRRQDPGPNGNRSIRHVENREHNPASEEILQAARLVREAEAGLFEDFRRDPEGLGERIPVIWSPPNLELPHDCSVVATAAEVLARPSSIGCRQQPLVVPRHRLVHGLVELRPALGLASERRVLGNGDSSLRRQESHRVGEVKVVHLTDEGDRVSRCPAPEAVVEPLLAVHRERRGSLLVERTESRPPPTHSLERHSLGNERDDVSPRANFGDVIGRNCHGVTVARSASCGIAHR